MTWIVLDMEPALGGRIQSGEVVGNLRRRILRSLLELDFPRDL